MASISATMGAWHRCPTHPVLWPQRLAWPPGKHLGNLDSPDRTSASESHWRMFWPRWDHCRCARKCYSALVQSSYCLKDICRLEYTCQISGIPGSRSKDDDPGESG